MSFDRFTAAGNTRIYLAERELQFFTKLSLSLFLIHFFFFVSFPVLSLQLATKNVSITLRYARKQVPISCAVKNCGRLTVFASCNFLLIVLCAICEKNFNCS